MAKNGKRRGKIIWNVHWSSIKATRPQLPSESGPIRRRYESPWHDPVHRTASLRWTPRGTEPSCRRSRRWSAAAPPPSSPRPPPRPRRPRGSPRAPGAAASPRGSCSTRSSRTLSQRCPWPRPPPTPSRSPPPVEPGPCARSAAGWSCGSAAMTCKRLPAA